MIKLKKSDRLMPAEELMAMDGELVYILTLFQIDSMKSLRKVREDALAVYLFESSKKELKKRRQEILKYFDLSTFGRDLKKLVRKSK